VEQRSYQLVSAS